MNKQIISTTNAPQAIGCYSQAVKVGKTVYLSGQIGLNPSTMQLAPNLPDQAHQAFKNLQAVVMASGGDLAQIVKLTIYLTNMNDFATLNQVMTKYFAQPYPARAVIGVNELPKQALIEIEGILMLN